MSNVYIRAGHTRSGFSLLYHEVFDNYHPLIGDSATLYYLFLLRSRNNDPNSFNHGKSWRGRKGVLEKFRFSSKTLPLLDRILVAVELIEIETKPSGRGRDKIYYVVNDPLSDQEFKQNETRLVNNIKQIIDEKVSIVKMLGKQGVSSRNLS